jgi:SAM-dependent methyltransferase
MNKQEMLDFLRPVLCEDFLRDVVKEMKTIDPTTTSEFITTELHQMLKQAAYDAVYTLSILELPPKDCEILEVGAGTGVLGAYLYSKGWGITMLEPARIGFESHVHLFKRVALALGFPVERLLLCRVEDLSSHEGEYFDMIFSNNVLEHVDDVDECLTRMHSILRHNGRMVHNCPNYQVPYEPHFGVPLLLGAPAMTKYFLPRRIRESGLWKSLNFITARQVCGVAATCGARVEFQTGVFYDALSRLEDDPEYARRHQIIHKITRAVSYLGLLKVFKIIPEKMATPMIFTWIKA